MQLAAIDIGTNSLHMILVRVAPDGSFTVVGREKDMVRLGAGGLEGRPLSEAAMTVALQTLSRFKRLADSRAVDEIIAVATSAVREAPNGGDFLAAIKHHTGIDARIITGVEEARLIHRAAVHGVDVGTGTAVVIDIGGGSTEITYGTAAGAQQARSFRLGVIRLTERFGVSDPLSQADQRRMARHIRAELGGYLASLAKAGYTRVIGTSGTALSLGALALGTPSVATESTIHHRRVPARSIRRIREQLTALSLDDRLALPGLDPKRADLAVSGAVLLDIILRQLEAVEITLCGVSLREGAVLDYVRRNRVAIERIERYPDIRRRSVMELAQRGGSAAEHAQQVSRLALAIFDQTQALHRLNQQAREWLELASVVHDIGEHISYEDHHRHSYYMVKNGDLRGFEPDEIEVIALLTRYHRRGTPKKSHPTFARLPRPVRRAVRWLSAMLRVAESLDRSRAQLVERVTLAEHAGAWRMRVTGRADLELEIWAAQRNSGPLAEELGAPLRVEGARAVPRPTPARPRAARRHRPLPRGK
ncbi:MAG: Ppx/GppA phosphatase family protein [Acidobacteriota bacterium]